MPDISIIIPVYNTEQYLPRCLDSILAQTHKNLEIIVVDDASPGNCREIVEQYQQRDDRIRYVRHVKNRSVLQARITGVQQARGKYLLPVDSDDWISPDVCAKTLATAEKYNADLVRYPLYIVEHTGKKATPDPSRRSFTVLRGEAIMQDFCANPKALWDLHHLLVRNQLMTEVLHSLPLKDIHINNADDLCLSLPLLFRANTVVYDDSAGKYYYFHSANSLTRREIAWHEERWRKYCTYYAEVQDMMLTYLRSENAPPDIIEGVRKKIFLTFTWLFDKIRSFPRALLLRRFSFLASMVSPHLAGGYLLSQNYINESTFDLLRILVEKAAPSARPRNIRHIGIFVGSLGGGGAERVACLLADLFSKAGYRVTVFPLICVEQEYPLTPAAQRVTLPHAAQERWEALPSHIQERNIDLCLFFDHWEEQTMFDILCARLTGCYVVGREASSFFFPFHGGNPQLFSLRQQAYPCADALTCLSRTDLAIWRAAGLKNSLYMPSPLTFDPELVPRSHGKDHTVLFVGRFVASKGVFLLPLLAALVARQVPHMLLLVAGKFSNKTDRQRFEALCHKLGVTDRVRLLGRVEDPSALYAQSRVHILPSCVEGSPRVLMEAKAHAVPSVLFEMPYLEAATEEDGCIMVGKEDVEGMATTVVKLLTDDAYWSHMAARAKNSLEQFAPELIMPKWQALFAALEENRMAEFLKDEPLAPADVTLGTSMREFSAAMAVCSVHHSPHAQRHHATTQEEPPVPDFPRAYRVVQCCFPARSWRRRVVLWLPKALLFLCACVRKSTDFLCRDGQVTSLRGHPEDGYFSVFRRFVGQIRPRRQR